MELSQETIESVVCPQCRGDLKYTREKVLLCVKCRVCYPVSEGIPHLSPSQAIPLSEDGHMIPLNELSTFCVTTGPDEGLRFRLEQGECKAIGRQVDERTETQVFNVDFTIALDERTKKLIKNYLSKASGGKKTVSGTGSAANELGAFRRGEDIILSDPGISRLHAMIFCDEKGAGIIDLVSRNGTFINGLEVEACRIKPGDTVKLGKTEIKFS